MKRKTRFTNKFYTHLDIKKDYKNYTNKIKNPRWIEKHGFYPFIHYEIKSNKLTKNFDEINIKEKKRHIYYSAHIDRFIYQHYGNMINNMYNQIAIRYGINKVVTAYRNNLKGKCNIHFAKEAFEFICKNKSVFIFTSDFTNFFDNLEHNYLKEKLLKVLDVDRLPNDHYAVFKSITKFSYIDLKDIEKKKKKKAKEMRGDNKYFETKEFKKYKKEILHRNDESYGIPQGSSISSVYSNVYMIDFDKEINDFVTSKKGLFRRYCDDVIIIIPIKDSEINKEVYKEYIDKINFIAKQVPRLEMNMDKTEYYIYIGSQQKLINLTNKKSVLNYLGFSFDGNCVKIREKAITKYYYRAYRKIRTIKKYLGKSKEKKLKTKLFRLYTHIGDVKYSNKKRYGNFITYARRAKEIFDKSNLVNNKIHYQIKRHWLKINKRLKA